MKASELRIGNKFMDDYGSIHTVCGLDRAGFVFFRGMHPVHDKKIHQSLIKGVPITEEWLLKFGFTKQSGGVFKNISLPYWVKNGFCLFFNEDPLRNKGRFSSRELVPPPTYTYLIGFGFNHFSDYFAYTGRWIDKVHELQNSYFECKGEELTVKETV